MTSQWPLRPERVKVETAWNDHSIKQSVDSKLKKNPRNYYDQNFFIPMYRNLEKYVAGVKMFNVGNFKIF